MFVLRVSRENWLNGYDSEIRKCGNYQTFALKCYLIVKIPESAWTDTRKLISQRTLTWTRTFITTENVVSAYIIDKCSLYNPEFRLFIVLPQLKIIIHVHHINLKCLKFLISINYIEKN